MLLVDCTSDPEASPSTPPAGFTGDPTGPVRAASARPTDSTAEPVPPLAVLGTDPIALGALAAGAVALGATAACVAAGAADDAVGSVTPGAADPSPNTPEPEPAVPEEELAAPVTEPMAAEAVLTTGVTGSATTLPAPGSEAADVPPAATDDRTGVTLETADVTADTAVVSPEVPGDAGLLATNAGLSGGEAIVAACACRDSSSKRTKMPAASSAACTALSAMRRIISCGISSSHVPKAGVGLIPIISELEPRIPAYFGAVS
jgi:hypothetical protein